MLMSSQENHEHAKHSSDRRSLTQHKPPAAGSFRHSEPPASRAAMKNPRFLKPQTPVPESELFSRFPLPASLPVTPHAPLPKIRFKCDLKDNFPPGLAAGVLLAARVGAQSFPPRLQPGRGRGSGWHPAAAGLWQHRAEPAVPGSRAALHGVVRAAPGGRGWTVPGEPRAERRRVRLCHRLEANGRGFCGFVGVSPKLPPSSRSRFQNVGSLATKATGSAPRLPPARAARSISTAGSCHAQPLAEPKSSHTGVAR